MGWKQLSPTLPTHHLDVCLEHGPDSAQGFVKVGSTFSDSLLSFRLVVEVEIRHSWRDGKGGGREKGYHAC